MSDKSNSNDAVSPAPIGEIEHGPSQFEAFLEKNFKLILLGALLIIIAVAAFVITRQLGDAKAREAGHALLAAKDPEALQAVSSNFPDSAADFSAKILLADQLWNEGKEEEAEEALEAIIASGEEHSSIRHAKFALATIQLKKGESAAAQSHFEAILNDSSAKGLHPLSLIYLGDIAKLAGEDEKAKSYYDRRITDYDGFADQGLAVTRLNMVGVDAPQAVSPPAEPEVSPTPSISDIPPVLIPPGPPAVETTPLTEEVEGDEPATEENTNAPEETPLLSPESEESSPMEDTSEESQ